MKVVAIEAGEVSKGAVPRKGMKRGLSILDFVLRIMAGVATLASAVAKGTTQERLPFATQFAMMSLVTAAASAAAAIVYKAHKGNPNVNWFAISQQYNSFCERILGSLIGSFIAVAVFIIPIIISAVLISRH